MFWEHLIFGLTLISFVAAKHNCSSEEWQCENGDCVVAEARCDGVFQCQDASDERFSLCRGSRRPMLGIIMQCAAASEQYQGVCPEVCHQQPQYCSYALLSGNEMNKICSFPQYPKNGNYVVHKPNGIPQTGLADFHLKFSCRGGWNLRGESKVYCVNGNWTHNFPECVQANCGEISSNQTLLNSTKEVRDIVTAPWHVGVFRKVREDFKTAMQICGGTLITSALIVSSASCFWDDDLERLVSLKRHQYVIAAGKFKRVLGDPQDIYAQTSEVREINLPSDFKGASNNYHSDIAVVVLGTPFVLTDFVRPVCLGVRPYAYGHQENRTRLAGWGPDTRYSNADLKIHEVSTLWSCPSNKITDDQICGNLTQGTACIGDTGCGVVSRDASGIWRLRGVVSLYRESCRDKAEFVLTRIEDHEQFVMGFL